MWPALLVRGPSFSSDIGVELSTSAGPPVSSGPAGRHPRRAELDDVGHFLELFFRGGQADGEAFAFALPAALLSFFDSFLEIDRYLLEPRLLSGVWPEHGTSDAGVFVGAGCPISAPAAAQLELALSEVVDEVVPLGVGGVPIFLARAQGPALTALTEIPQFCRTRPGNFAERRQRRETKPG